jgi:hypothetical protein
MIADKVSQEGCRFRRARILRNHMNAVRLFVEAITGPVNGLGTPLDPHPHRALENVADYRTRMAMWRGRAARRIGHLDCRHLQVGGI